jgi:hypothetical protein
MEIAFEQRKLILVVFLWEKLSLYGTQDFILARRSKKRLAGNSRDR